MCGHVATRHRRLVLGLVARQDVIRRTPGVHEHDVHVAPEVAKQVCEDLQSFANYGFPESHAWSFALIAYATAWLKAHYPVEFLQLPEEVLTTTMIHHQHFFPLMNEHGKLQPVFLAVLNMEGDRPELISRNL